MKTSHRKIGQAALALTGLLAGPIFGLFSLFNLQLPDVFLYSALALLSVFGIAEVIGQVCYSYGHEDGYKAGMTRGQETIEEIASDPKKLHHFRNLFERADKANQFEELGK